MASKEQFSYIAFIVGIIMAIFMVVEALIWGGFLSVPQLGNLNNVGNKLFENPAFVGLLATIIVGAISGFMENYTKSKQTFNPAMFAETFFFYEPLMLLFGQFLPAKYAIVFLFGIDIVRRLAKAFVQAKLTPATPT